MALPISWWKKHGMNEATMDELHTTLGPNNQKENGRLSTCSLKQWL